MKVRILIPLLVSLLTLTFQVESKTINNNIKINVEKKIDKDLKYELNIDYPNININNKVIENKVNKDIKFKIDSIKNKFIKDIASSFKDNTISKDSESGLTINTKVVNHDKSTLSLRLDVSSYYAGSAHPNNEIVTLNYDLNNGNQIYLKDLFKNKTGYMKLLSDYTYKSLAKNSIDLEWLKLGTSPKDENFDTFNLTKEYIIIYFQNYQVASYAEGPKEIKIPKTSMKSILK